MPRRPSSFKQADLQRALRAAKAAGLDVERVDIDSAGKISIVIGKGAANLGGAALDHWLNTHAHQFEGRRERDEVSR